jgi:6-pyruvoyltetrahydropterin/6-carboxytetrahydropterin synthase
MLVEFKGDINENGMVLDYFDVKEIVGPIVEELDHAVIVNKNDTKLLEALIKLNSNHVVVDFESTAENLCHYFLNKIKNADLPNNITNIMIKIFETENTYAEESLCLEEFKDEA